MILSTKAQFVRHAFPDTFVKEERLRNHHIPHSVCLLVLSPRGDQAGLVCPVQAHIHKQPQVLVPPQLRMEPSSINKVYRFGDPEQIATSVVATARVLAQEILNRQLVLNQDVFGSSGAAAMARNKLVYLGSTRGDNVTAEQRKNLAKHVHWVAVRVDDTGAAFRKNSSVYFSPQWCASNRLSTLPSYFAMSERKLQMMRQALKAYSKITGDDNPLARNAQACLAQRNYA